MRSCLESTNYSDVYKTKSSLFHDWWRPTISRLYTPHLINNDHINTFSTSITMLEQGNISYSSTQLSTHILDRDLSIISTQPSDSILVNLLFKGRILDSATQQTIIGQGEIYITDLSIKHSSICENTQSFCISIPKDECDRSYIDNLGNKGIVIKHGDPAHIPLRSMMLKTYNQFLKGSNINQSEIKQILEIVIKNKNMGSEIHHKINEIIDHHHNNNKLNYDFIASNLNISKSSLYRKTENSINIKDLINQRRLVSFINLFANRELSIEEAALKSGFNNIQQLNRAMKIYENQTASSFVKNHSRLRELIKKNSPRNTIITDKNGRIKIKI